MHVIIRATVLSCAFTFATAAGGVKLNKKAYPVEAVVAIFKDFHPTASEADLAGIALALKGLEASDTSPEAAGGVKLNKKAYPVEAVVAIFKDFHPTASEADLAGIALALKGLEASDTSPEAAGGVKLNKKAYPVEAVVAIFKDFHPTASEADLAGIALALKGLEASDTSPEAVPSDDAEDADVDGLPGVEDSARHLSEACADSETWHKKGDDKKNCAWVGKKAASRCKAWVKSEGGVLASDACPVACDTCPATCAEGRRADSTTWHQGWKKSKTCAWVGKSPAKRCDKESKSKVLASDACPVACDACPTWAEPDGRPHGRADLGSHDQPDGRPRPARRRAVPVPTTPAMTAAPRPARRPYGDDGYGYGDDGYGYGGSVSPTPAPWIQRGDDIDGEAADDWSGYSVSLSADGTTLAVGAPYNDGAGSNAGHARVFAWDPVDETWKQRGDDIDGEAAGDESGRSVSLSADGATLAVGAVYNDGAGSSAGHARVFAWDSDDETWVQRGDDIDGEAAGDRSGYSVSLSADGTTLAVGAVYNDGAGSSAGHARVFAWDSNDDTWIQRGDDIDGEAAGDESGRSVSLSADGATLAVGAVYNDGAGSSAGHARVFAWDSNDDTWIQRGDDIDGEAAFDQSGYSVSLSADGTTLARGDDIDGEAANDESGYSVSLSADGAALAVGASGNDGGGNSAGHARVFDLSRIRRRTRLRACLGRARALGAH
ncbi:hypothetical protein JL722_1803 [Aureococcus anophagefferens]|nr:hypothetical protein JL722_1803 [Aureococcus anophagefferens]